jgi:sugar phosphate isomerase/epimerase
MTLGLSTYAFFWQWHDTATSPLSLSDMIEKTAGWDVKLFQICDYPALDSYDNAGLAKLQRHAESCGVTLELGTRGVTPSHLLHYVHIAKLLGARLVRSMINTADHRPTPEEAVRMLGQSTPAYEQAGVTLALETYEQVPVRDLVGIVDAVDSPNLGICLDPANCVAALEHPRDTVELTAPRVANVHVKDFAFTRQAGWVGFSLVGAPLGNGLLDYDHLAQTVQPDRRGISQVVEHWLPWQGDSLTTVNTEDQWTLHNLDYLRSKQA